MVPDWSEAKEFFERDGGLRDIYVHDTDQGDWERLLAALPSSPWSCEYSFDGEQAPYPTTFEQARSYEGAALLKIDEGVLRLRCHFFCVEQMEFDVLPEDVKGRDEYDRLVSFMGWIAQLLGKPAVITHEGTPSGLFLRVERRH